MYPKQIERINTWYLNAEKDPRTHVITEHPPVEIIDDISSIINLLSCCLADTEIRRVLSEPWAKTYDLRKKMEKENEET